MNKLTRQFLPFGTLILIFAVLAALRPETFLTFDNFMNVLRRSSIPGIIALGMTFIIISAGIDLSVGSMLAIAGMCCGLFISVAGKDNPNSFIILLGTITGVVTGLIAGLGNGLMITKLKLPPFIVTLGTMSAFRGISYVMNDGQPYDLPTYRYLGDGVIAGIPVSLLIYIVIIILSVFLLNYTRLGRYTYAIGSNKEAAYHSGINVDWNLISIYTLTGIFVGIAAMIQNSRTVSSQPTAGLSMELDVIAAVVIGGASLSGGRGTITGTIVGTLLISFLRNGCTLLGISTNIQLIVIGAIIIVAVSVDQLAQSKAKQASS